MVAKIKKKTEDTLKLQKESRILSTKRYGPLQFNISLN